MAATRGGSSQVGRGRDLGECAELDSHANVVCLGKHCSVIRRTGVTMKVNAFASSLFYGGKVDCNSNNHIF